MSVTGAAELGTTQDPKALVPGSVETVEADAATLTARAKTLDGVAGALKKVDIASWWGPAASSFQSAFAKEPPKWRGVADILDEAAAAMVRHAGTLSSAQGKAADAIAKWNAGEKATADWETAKAQEVCEVPSLGPAPISFDSADPGAAQREEAQEILDDARKQVHNSGMEAARLMASMADLKPPHGGTTESDWFGAEGDAKGPSISWGKQENEYGTSPWSDYRGEGGKDSPFELSLGEINGAAWVWRGSADWDGAVGPVDVAADGSIVVLGADGHASAKIDGDGLGISAGAAVDLVHANGTLRGEYGIAEGGVELDARVSALAEGELTLGPNGGHAEGELFAGAKAGAKGDIDVGGVGVEGGAEGWAGIGVGGDVDFGYDGGKVHIGGSGGLAFGLGGKVSGGVTLDLPKIAETAGDAADTLTGWID
jgi:hypothetical protein